MSPNGQLHQVGQNPVEVVSNNNNDIETENNNEDVPQLKVIIVSKMSQMNINRNNDSNEDDYDIYAAFRDEAYCGLAGTSRKQQRSSKLFGFI